MKTVTYNLVDGGTKTVEYDETAPCIICGQPVVEASMGGTVICPWCDCGHCRYCGVQLPLTITDKDAVKKHMKWHIEHPVKENRKLSIP